MQFACPGILPSDAILMEKRMIERGVDGSEWFVRLRSSMECDDRSVQDDSLE
jgi:hypothetical protein